jgi:hypothetical protein
MLERKKTGAGGAAGDEAQGSGLVFGDEDD